MSVRIKIEIQALNKSSKVEAICLLNSGFESETPQILLPSRVAELLGLLPNLPASAVTKTYDTAGEYELKMHFLENSVKINVLTEDRKSVPILNSALISEQEREVILSDNTIDSLGIDIISFSIGEWRFKGETKIRASFKKQLW